MNIEQLKERISEKLKDVEKHRMDVCQYLNTPSRLKDEDICKKIDGLSLSYRMIGRWEGQLQTMEYMETKTKKEEKVS